MDTYKKLLGEFLALKSISTDPQYAGEIKKTAEWLKDLLEKHDFSVRIIEGYANPIVAASYVANPKFETVLVYGHYDVQPAAKEDGWLSEPFTLTEREGKLYGRGVVDNKGQVLIHIATVLDLIKEKKLAYNVKFMIEGDEETGGMMTGKALADFRDELKADYVMISDGEIPYKPTITASFRGTFNCSVRYTTAANNLHSGLCGGAVPNAAHELARLIAKLNDEEYTSQVPGLEVPGEIPAEAMVKAKEMDIHKEAMLGHTKIKQFFLGKQQSFVCRTGFETMLTVSGLKSGYIGEGYSNIVPNMAEMRVNCRVAAPHDPQQVYKRFADFVREQTPAYVELEMVEPKEFAKPILVDLTSAKHQEVMKLMAKVYGDEVLIDYCGASIPIVVDFKEVIGVDPLLVSLGNDDCNMHGANENFDMGLIEKGLEFSRRFFGQPE